MFGDILDIVDCGDCPSFRHTPAKTWGDPDSCYDAESECGDGDLGNECICDVVADAIEDGIRNGEFSTEEWYLATADFMMDAPQADREALGTDFTTADFWLVFYGGRSPVPLKDIKAVYNACFA
jgi:hypothetical protein